MKYQIMIDIMMTLLSKRKMTARQLADKYEISARSVYRYVEELNVCGVPVDVERGRYGGISIPDTFRLPSYYFTREEYAATVNALGAMASQMNDKSILTAMDKLQRRQKAEKRELSICGNILVDGGNWWGGNKFSEKMKVCEQAVNESKSLIIDYISRSGEHSKRVIDPHLLIFKQNIWYVYAFCHTKQTFRTFKIGRIKNAAFTGSVFSKREFTRDEIDLDFYVSADKLISVTLEIEKGSLSDAEEWLGIDNIEPVGGGFIARLALPDDGGLVNKILSYGGAVKVIEPPELKRKVIETAQKITSSY
ncbi:MAG: YafY family transcriptional regulator [Clostridia bacterium]|nr:YafY family transcriptional regulator [Clostridia bacterium]